MKLRHDEDMKKIIRYIYAHYSEKIRIEELAKTASISRRELFRYFNQYVGQNPMEYINDYRLKKTDE